MASSALCTGKSARLNKYKLGCLSLMIALSTGCFQQASAELPQGFDDFVNKVLKEYNTPGAAIAVVEGDKVYLRGYGVRSVDKPGAVDPDTLFMLASNTKPFTAALLAIMVDQHKIGWNDHVIDYMPQFVLHDRYATRMCTAKDLLAHRTGLPAFFGDGLEGVGYDRNEVMRRLKYIEPACSFRETANYSNPGFFAAGMLAGVLAGDSWDNLIKKKLFEPLSMTRSGVTVKDHDRDSNVADAHEALPQGGAKVVPWDTSDVFGPAGSINSTAKDMARWMQLQLNEGSIDGHQIISPESMREMHTPAMVDKPGFGDMPPIDEKTSGLCYGLGWGIYHYNGHVIFEKTGARTGMRSSVVLIPDKKLGITVLANQNLTLVPEAVRAYLIDKMVAPAGTDLQAEISKKNAGIQKIFNPAPPPKPTTSPTLPLEGYAGEYQNDLFGKVKISMDSGKLRWQAGPKKVSGPISHVQYDTFQLAWPPGPITLPEEVTFTLGTDGHPSQLQTVSFGLLKRVSQ